MSLGDRRTKLGRPCFTEFGENPGKSVLPLSDVGLMFLGCLTAPERGHSDWFAGCWATAVVVAKLWLMVWFCLVGVDLWLVILAGEEIKRTSSDGFVGEDDTSKVCFRGDLCVIVFPLLEGQCLLAGFEL